MLTNLFNLPEDIFDSYKHNRNSSFSNIPHFEEKRKRAVEKIRQSFFQQRIKKKNRVWSCDQQGLEKSFLCKIHQKQHLFNSDKYYIEWVLWKDASQMTSPPKKGTKFFFVKHDTYGYHFQILKNNSSKPVLVNNIDDLIFEFFASWRQHQQILLLSAFPKIMNTERFKKWLIEEPDRQETIDLMIKTNHILYPEGFQEHMHVEKIDWVVWVGDRWYDFGYFLDQIYVSETPTRYWTSESRKQFLLQKESIVVKTDCPSIHSNPVKKKWVNLVQSLRASTVEPKKPKTKKQN